MVQERRTPTMQIKQVSRLTGLSERTIRYYEQEGLVVPAQTDRNGRAFREYAEEDVATLTHISRLRRAEFSIAEIREILADAKCIPGVLMQVRQRLEQETESKRRILEALGGLDSGRIQDVPALSDSLKRATERIALPASDVHPNFGKFDGIGKDEREQEYQAYLSREGRFFSNWFRRRPKNAPDRKVDSQGALRCPNCSSNRVRVERVGDGVGFFALGVATNEYASSPFPSAPSVQPNPPPIAYAGDELGNGPRMVCKACGTIFHAPPGTEIRANRRRRNPS
jgi:DNA-binding transcriptional MerR regulator